MGEGGLIGYTVFARYKVWVDLNNFVFGFVFFLFFFFGGGGGGGGGVLFLFCCLSVVFVCFFPPLTNLFFSI